MRLGGIIAGALGGGAQAVGQMADANLKAQAEEERMARERAARMQEAQTQRQWRREDAIAEMDQRLARIGTEVKAKAQASIEAQGMLNTEREKIRGGLIGAEIDKAIPPHIAEQSKNWSPEAQAQLAADREAVRTRAMSDPNVGRDVGLVMGEITQKDIMANDVAQERAANQALRDKMRADQEATKEEGRNSRADAQIAALIGRGKSKAEKEEKLNTTISTHRQMIASSEDRLKRLKLMEPDSPETKALEADIQNSRDVIRAATKMQQENLGMSGDDSASGAQDNSSTQSERIRIIKGEYDAAVKRGDSDVASATARELQRLGFNVNQAQKSGVEKQSSSASGGSIVSVNTKDQYDQLPSGTRFKAPDGTTRIKP